MSLSNSMQELIDRYGQEYTLRYITNSSFDLSDPTGAPTTTSSDITVKAYPSTFKTRELLDTLIKANDIKLVMGSKDTGENDITSPSLEDKIVQGDNLWTISHIRKVYESDNIPVFVLALRK